MPRTSLTEIEKRIRALHIGVQIQVYCNRGLILIVEKQMEPDKIAVGGQYHAWIEPSNPDGTETNLTGNLESLMALIAVQRKREPKGQSPNSKSQLFFFQSPKSRVERHQPNSPTQHLKFTLCNCTIH